MPLRHDEGIAREAILYRILQHKGWTTNKGGKHRPSSIAFFEVDGEVSYFIDSDSMVPELRRIFPGADIARVPASVVIDAGFAIERRPNECPEDFRCNPACHVVVGPAQPMEPNDYEKRARSIAKHPDVGIVPK